MGLVIKVTVEEVKAIYHQKGFTLIEVISVVTVLGILAVILIPSGLGVIQKAEERVCSSNCGKLEEMYIAYLRTEDILHTDTIFVQFLQENGMKVCPRKGSVSFIDNEVRCSMHSSLESDDKEEVPFL